MSSSTPSAARDPRMLALGDLFVVLADTLVADFDVVDLMDRLTDAAVDLLDVSSAGLLLADQRGDLQVVSASAAQAHELELVQVAAGEGPCLECVRTGRPVTVGDLAVEHERWPDFVAAAHERGVRSVHAVPMRLREEVIGGLNLFGSNRGALAAEDRRLAQSLADVATIGILQQRSVHRSALLAEQLQAALTTRIVVEQAKGVLAQFGGVTVDEAFRVLRRWVRDRNLLLGEVASQLVTGSLSPGVMLPRAG